jgi:hypothetical protein
MASKEEDYRHRFAAIVLDLSTSDDAEATALLGSLGGRIISHAGMPTWSALKQNLTQRDYDALLRTFQTQGNDLARQGQLKQVHAIEVLAVALVAKTQMRDPEIASGAPILDQIIDDAIAAVRQAQPIPDPIISS